MMFLVLVTIFSFVFDVGQSQRKAYHNHLLYMYIKFPSTPQEKTSAAFYLRTSIINPPSSPYASICTLRSSEEPTRTVFISAGVVRFLYPQRRTFRSSKWGFTIWRHLTTGGSWNNSSPNKKKTNRTNPSAFEKNVNGTTRSWVAKERDPRLIHY